MFSNNFCLLLVLTNFFLYCNTFEDVCTTRDIFFKEKTCRLSDSLGFNKIKPTAPNGLCGFYSSVIDGDLQPYQEGVTKSQILEVTERGTKYQVIAHKLHRQKHCMFPSRCSGIEHFIKQLLPELPNMEMIINCRDWPQIHKHFEKRGPVFSFSKTDKYLDIMYPSWSFWEGGPAISLYPVGLGRWDKHRISITEASKKWPWDKKESRGFFRGSRTSDERDSLVLLSRKHPELVNAQYTKNQAWKSPKDTLHAEPAEEMSLEDHCPYKYLFNFRGVAASFRFKHLFLCKSLVIHVGNEWKEFFYEKLGEWQHYVPLKSYPSEEELEHLIRYLQANDSVAQEIAGEGYKFIRNHLRMKDVECYWRELLLKYAKLLRYEVELDKELIPIV